MWTKIFSVGKTVVSFLGGATFLWNKVEQSKDKKEHAKHKTSKHNAKGRA